MKGPPIRSLCGRGLDDLGVCPRRLASRPAMPTPSCGSYATGLQWQARRKARKKDWGTTEPSWERCGGSEERKVTRPAVPTSRLVRVAFRTRLAHFSVAASCRPFGRTAGLGSVTERYSLDPGAPKLGCAGPIRIDHPCTSVWERKRARIVRFW